MALLSLAGARWGSQPAATPAAPPPIVVAARPLVAGSVLAPADLELRAAGLEAGAPGVLRSPAGLSGRRLLVTVPGGTPVLVPMLGPPLAPADRRTVVVAVDRAHLDPGLAVGAAVDVIAAVDGDHHGGSVSAVATAVVVSVTPAADPPATSGPTAERAGGPAVAVALDCDAVQALRIVWAESFARGLRLLVRAGDGGPGLGTATGLAG